MSDHIRLFQALEANLLSDAVRYKYNSISLILKHSAQAKIGIVKAKNLNDILTKYPEMVSTVPDIPGPLD